MSGGDPGFQPDWEISMNFCFERRRLEQIAERTIGSTWKSVFKIVEEEK
jgi:hypothetical protein